MTGADDSRDGALRAALDVRDAVAFFHAGSVRDPAVRYCSSSADSLSSPAERSLELETRALGFDGSDWLVTSDAASAGHPAAELAERLADHTGTGTVLTPARIPHDAALYLERAGFSLASTDAVERARATKTVAEIERIAAAQRAAGAGVRRGAALLADATIDDGRLVDDGEVTRDRLRRAIDAGIVAAIGFPAGNTIVTSATGDGTLEPREPIVVATAPRSSAGYYGGVVRTLVVDSDGGPERRAHVGVTQAFRSVQAMLTADAESVTALEADLEAEIRGFGFPDEPIETRVAGVGLEPIERPSSGSDEVGSGAVVRVEAGVEYEPDRWIRLAGVLAVEDDGVRWLEAPSRSIDPSTLCE